MRTSSAPSAAADLAATRRPGLVLVAVLVTVMAWASAFVAIRALGEAFSPGALALGRLVVGAVALGAVMLARRAWVRPSDREWALVAVCGWRGSRCTTSR